MLYLKHGQRLACRSPWYVSYSSVTRSPCTPHCHDEMGQTILYVLVEELVLIHAMHTNTRWICNFQPGAASFWFMVEWNRFCWCDCCCHISNPAFLVDDIHIVSSSLFFFSFCGRGKECRETRLHKANTGSTTSGRCTNLRRRKNEKRTFHSTNGTNNNMPGKL